MTKSEKKYATRQRESPAVVFALRRFHVHLLSSIKFKLITDHQALKYAFQNRDVHGTLARWFHYLAEHEFAMEHHPGKKTASVDYLSRISVESTQVQEYYDEEYIPRASTIIDNYEGLEPHLSNTASYVSGEQIKNDKEATESYSPLHQEVSCIES